MRALVVILLVTLLLGVASVALAVSGNLPFASDPTDGRRGKTPRSAVDRFDGSRAFELLERQVELGPRPAGSRPARRLAALLREELPNGRYQRVPGGLRNVVGEVRGSDPDRMVVVGAHYDTKDIPGFVGANDGASGTATVVELARTIQPGELDPSVVFILFDGEESPRGTPDDAFEQRGLRGSKVAAAAHEGAEAMILLDFVGDRDLSIPREANSDRRLWSRLREAAAEVGQEDVFPDATRGPILDDHVPFRRAGVPAIDLIDFDFPCFHKRCDDLSAVSAESVDAVGETVLQLLRTL